MKHHNFVERISFYKRVYMCAIKKTILLVMIPIVFLVVTAFVGKSVGSDGYVGPSNKVKCDKEPQTNTLHISNFELSFNLSDKTGKEGYRYSDEYYREDKEELWWNAHNNMWVQTNDYITGKITSFSGIMDCYERYKNIDKNRVPSVSVKFEGNYCEQSFLVYYYPFSVDMNHYCAINDLRYIPMLTPNAVESGILSIKTIKTKKNGMQLLWEAKISSDYIENLNAIMKSDGSISNGELKIKQLFLQATIICDPTNRRPTTVKPVSSVNYSTYTTNTSTVAFRRVGTPTKSSVSEMITVENTIPQDLSGKQVAIRLSENPEVIAPQLSGRVYMHGKYRTDVEWDSPLLYEVIEK